MNIDKRNLWFTAVLAVFLFTALMIPPAAAVDVTSPGSLFSIPGNATVSPYAEESYWLTIDTISDQKIGVPFTIQGKTNTEEGTPLWVLLVPERYADPHRSQSWQKFFFEGRSVVERSGNDTYNIWSFPVNTTDFIESVYVVHVSSLDEVYVSDTALFSVVHPPVQTPGFGLLSICSAVAGLVGITFLRRFIKAPSIQKHETRTQFPQEREHVAGYDSL